MRRDRDDAGSALLLALVIGLIIFSLALTALLVSGRVMRDSGETWEARQALFTAEAGVHQSIALLNGQETAGNADVGDISETDYGKDGRFAVDASAGPADQVIIRSVGEVLKRERGVEVVVGPGVHFGFTSAFTMFGGAASATFDIDPDSHVQFNGKPGKVPALAFEDDELYAEVMEQIADDIVSGDLSSSTFKGTPEVDYTNSDGETVSEPIKNYEGVFLDSSVMEDIRTSMIGKAATEWMPNADVTISENTTIDADTVYGSKHDPQVVVFNAENVTLTDGAKLRGTGTLIVTGEMLVDDDAFLDWEGNVIILGGNDFESHEAKMQLSDGTLHVDGNVFVLGAEGGSSRFHIDNPDSTGSTSSHTVIHGSVVALSGTTGEEARVKIEDGTTHIFGMLLIEGSSHSEFILADDDEGPFNGVLNINGAMAIGNSDPDGILDVDLAGNLNLTFHRKNFQDAVTGFNDTVKTLGLKLPYTLRLWREFIP